MLKKIVSLLLSLSLVLGICMMAPLASAAEFADAEDISTEYREAVELLTALNVMDNRVEDLFHPTSTITREEMARMIAVLSNAGNDVSNGYVSDFADVPKDRWSASYITYCVKTGIITGRSATTFDPTGSVTGLETAKMLLVLLGFDAEERGYTGSNWKENVLRDAKATGLLNGMPEDYVTDDPITREEAQQMVLRALDAPRPIGEPLVQKNYGMESVEQLKDTVLPYTMEEAEDAAQQIALGPYCDPEELEEEPEEENPDQKISSTSYAQVVLDAAAEATGIPAVQVVESAIYFSDGTLAAKVSSDVILATMRQNHNANTAMKQLLGGEAKAVVAAVGTPELSKQITVIREKNIAELAERTPATFQTWTKVTDRYQSEDPAALYSAIAFGALGVYDAPGSSVSADPDAPMTWGELAKFLAYLVLGQEAADALTYDGEDPYGDHPYAPYIHWAVENGYGAAERSWDGAVTRGQFLKALMRLMKNNPNLMNRMLIEGSTESLMTRDEAAQLLSEIAKLQKEDGSGETVGDALGYVYTAPPSNKLGTKAAIIDYGTVYTATNPVTKETVAVTVNVADDDGVEIRVYPQGNNDFPYGDEYISGQSYTVDVPANTNITVDVVSQIISKILSGEEVIFDAAVEAVPTPDSSGEYTLSSGSNGNVTWEITSLGMNASFNSGTEDVTVETANLTQQEDSAAPPTATVEREVDGDLEQITIQLDPSTGETEDNDPAGEDPTGEDPTGEDPAGEIPVEGEPTGEIPTGEDPAGEIPTGGDPAGEIPTGGDPTGQPPENAPVPANEELIPTPDTTPAPSQTPAEIPSTPDPSGAE